MKRADLIRRITYYLTHLRMQVEALNSLNLQDDNVHAENFFRDFLNLALGYELRNINIVEPNAAAVDLGDENQRIAIQVTSTSDIEKIKHTHSRFVKAGLQSKYDRLVVIIIGEKKDYRVLSLGTAQTIALSTSDDVWGVAELLRKINDLTTPKLEPCLDFLREELRISEPRVINEVNTLVRLIEVLSAAEEGLSVGDNREDPDPEKKINDRFADHAEFLQAQYVDLHLIYGKSLVEVNLHTDLGHIRLLKLQVYLMRWSDRVLNACGGDPVRGLDTLTDKVLQMMGQSDAEYDDGAVRYYLIKQLIACNVFPNKRYTHA